jgi:chromate transporter
MEAVQIILTFLKIGLVSFGGGWSIVGIIKHEVVPRWITEEQFASLVAIAQSTPGPIALNTATMIGYSRGGLLLAAAATVSVVAAPILILILATLVIKRLPLHKNHLDESLRTISIAMMIMTLWALRPPVFDPLSLVYTSVAFLLGSFTKINLLWVILGAGLFNIIAGPFLRSALGM